MSRPKNDQTEVIKALQEKNFKKAWEGVKFIGYKEMPDIKMRYMIFIKAAHKFDAFINNNFIIYYKSYLTHNSADMERTMQYKFTNNVNTINSLKNYISSPTEDISDLAKEILKIIG